MHSDEHDLVADADPSINQVTIRVSFFRLSHTGGAAHAETTI